MDNAELEKRLTVLQDIEAIKRLNEVDPVSWTPDRLRSRSP